MKNNTGGQNKFPTPKTALKRILKICFVKMPYTFGEKEGVGLLDGTLVHWTPDRITAISLKRSISLVAKMTKEAHAAQDGTHWDTVTQLAWLEVIGRSLSSHTYGDC